MAVDDSDRAAPAISAALTPKPIQRLAAAMTASVTTTCKAPRPKTRRRMVMRRSKESSSPIRNSRKTTPNSASDATLAESAITRASRAGTAVTNCPSTPGLSAMPTIRKARMALTPMRRKSGTTSPATARIIRNSL